MDKNAILSPDLNPTSGDRANNSQQHYTPNQNSHCPTTPCFLLILMAVVGQPVFALLYCGFCDECRRDWSSW